jgi:Flp pilus assembly protein TadG
VRRHLAVGSRAAGAAGRDEGGQALVEFSLTIVVFLVLMMGVVDFGRAIYQYNGVSQAAREIARVTAVHPGSDFKTDAGRSSETKAVIQTQKGLIPNLRDPLIKCVDIAGNEKTTGCIAGDWVQVRISAPYTPVTPILGLAGTWDFFSSSTSVQLQ